MTQEEKQLLLRDLCARLPYGVKANSQASHLEINTIDGYFVDGDGRKMFHLSEPDFWQTVDDFQYYLRPMLSMTEEERQEFRTLILPEASCAYEDCLEWDAQIIGGGCLEISVEDFSNVINWLNVHHFDYCWLIEKGLALEASADMYKTE